MKPILLTTIGSLLCTNEIKIGFDRPMPELKTELNATGWRSENPEWRVAIYGCTIPSQSRCTNDVTFLFYQGSRKLTVGTNSEGVVFVTIHKEAKP